ncbi:hypothetical protein M7I_1542 [Glarea lozoyensis 74030]|uniref:DUF6594 domain-containing protein n=1 Tax=Glarea lozoyensis (strain ATCC 74030 / MF5533) TaxID=1104152 RepID=H0EGC6_GLAL7|nr:hypothetical protein M7I_1542 [Glarea lozoyensis 74030]
MTCIEWSAVELLQSLELQLEETEDASHPAGSDPGVYENRSFLRDSNPDRIKILEKIQVALISYDNFINGYHKLSDRPAVTSSDMCGIKAFLEDYPNAIYDKETSFLGHKRDLITVRPVMTNSFRFKIKYIVNCKKFLFKIRGLLCGGSGTDPEAKCAELRWVYDNKIQEKVTALVSMLGLALLIIPLWILGVSMASSSTMNKLILITVLVVVFYLLVAMATTAKLFESFASAAGRIRGGAHGVPSSHFQHNKMMMLFKLCTS